MGLALAQLVQGDLQGAELVGEPRLGGLVAELPRRLQALLEQAASVLPAAGQGQDRLHHLHQLDHGRPLALLGGVPDGVHGAADRRAGLVAGRVPGQQPVAHRAERTTQLEVLQQQLAIGGDMADGQAEPILFLLDEPTLAQQPQAGPDGGDITDGRDQLPGQQRAAGQGEHGQHAPLMLGQGVDTQAVQHLRIAGCAGRQLLQPAAVLAGQRRRLVQVERLPTDGLGQRTDGSLLGGRERASEVARDQPHGGDVVSPARFTEVPNRPSTGRVEATTTLAPARLATSWPTSAAPTVRSSSRITEVIWPSSWARCSGVGLKGSGLA
jgi:hypothetical protein